MRKCLNELVWMCWIAFLFAAVFCTTGAVVGSFAFWGHWLDTRNDPNPEPLELRQLRVKYSSLESELQRERRQRIIVESQLHMQAGRAMRAAVDGDAIPPQNVPVQPEGQP